MFHIVSNIFVSVRSPLFILNALQNTIKAKGRETITLIS